MKLNELSTLAHENAKRKGFYERTRELPELLMLVVGELSEAVEAERAGRTITKSFQGILKSFSSPKNWNQSTVQQYEAIVRGSIEEELADAFIRLFDVCGFYGVDIESAIESKMLYNETRPKKHGKKY